MKCFDNGTRKWNRSLLFDAIWQRDRDTMTKKMNLCCKKRSATMVIVKIFAMLFWLGSLHVPNIL